MLGKYHTEFCLRCVENVKHILPNGGLMMIYQEKKVKKISLNKSERLEKSISFKVYFSNLLVHS